jgi:hypothetical protein
VGKAIVSFGLSQGKIKVIIRVGKRVWTNCFHFVGGPTETAL